ncbi:MAG TPA: SUMF1/EgtB/PvdO family nonheme iron enzyme, partial [Gammaproteobacteria bacterium]
GKQEEGVCYDFVADKVRGPLLVVVPGADGSAPLFAIGKYEASVGEFNLYCAETNACVPIAANNDKLPVTGIKIRDARGYAKWLSDRASTLSSKPVIYRLPNADEWRHAAAAGGETPVRGINCKPEGGATLSSGLMRSEGGTLSLGVPIGRALVSATFGGENGWGVVNAVGNAQEWVTATGGLLAKGGAFQDPVAACSIQSNRPHDGDPDGITGFRLLRELK